MTYIVQFSCSLNLNLISDKNSEYINIIIFEYYYKQVWPTEHIGNNVLSIWRTHIWDHIN